MAYCLARRKGVDPNGGSGNPGASNALILMSWKAAILVGAHDIGKALLAVWLARLLFPGAALCGTAAGVASAVIIFKHRTNLARIANGTEIGFRSARSGAHRVK